MRGTILILDGVSTNRIMLKVQLSAAWYQVEQSDRIEGLTKLVERVSPDLILSAMTLPDGDVLQIRELLQEHEAMAHIPIVAMTAENDHAARLKALAAGIDDVLSPPFGDALLLARIRSLIRSHTNAEELRLQGATQPFGLAEAQASFTGAITSNVALVTQTPGTGAVWRARLKGETRHRIDLHKIEDMHNLLNERNPDAIILELCDSETGMRLLADLRARGVTRDAAVIAVPNPANAHLAADALDRGADDVMPEGFCVGELVLRLEAQLRRKARTDGYRDSVRDGLRAAIVDTMTGLYNRRYGMSELQRVTRSSVVAGEDFAVLLADLDHFKSINDSFGHPAGDAVLMETARRLRSQLRPEDIIARIGGEEFMIVLPGTSRDDALSVAGRLCQRIENEQFMVPGHSKPISATVSIGVSVCARAHAGHCLVIPEATNLFEQADRALYDAKEAGRNMVFFRTSAA